MTTAAILTLIVLAIGLVLFISEWLPIDLVAIGMMVALVMVGVISLEDGLAGFSNPATLTVAFMFILSAAMLRTGALQFITFRLAKLFERNQRLGLLAMMLFIALISAFVNNTPIVAVFIPVVIQIANRIKISPAKLLIPLSFASIMGGMCTLIGTSTNLVVNGIALEAGIIGISLFTMTLPALILLGIGLVFMVLFGFRLLPNRRVGGTLKEKFQVHSYLTDIQIIKGSSMTGKRIMDSSLVKELEMDILEVQRSGERFGLPPGDFILQEGDILKTRCNVEKMVALKDQARIVSESDLSIGDHKLSEGQSTLVEMVITPNAGLEGLTLREADFRRRFRAAPLAIRHREEVLHDRLYDVKLMPGDVLLAEVKNHFIPLIKQMERETDAPFVIVSELEITDFDRRSFAITMGLALAVIILAAVGLVNITLGVITAVVGLVVTKCISMKESYEAINWKIIFVMAGVLSLSAAMRNSGLDIWLSKGLLNHFSAFGPVVVLAVLYLITSLLTEVMSNTATAALMTPIAIATAISLDCSPLPFLVATMFAASASFMTPIGYQTNTMVYSAGEYRFGDFIKVGWILSILFWIAATFLIPIFLPF